MKTKKLVLNLSLFILLGSVLLLNSCRARFYTPNRNPVPLFQQAGDVYLDASTNMGTKGDLTAGLALMDGVGAYVGYAGAFQQAQSGDSALTETNTYKGNMLNLGLGYFLSKKASNSFRFEMYGDYGVGSYNNQIKGANNQFFNGRYKRVGLLTNIGFSSPDNTFMFAYSARFSRIAFSGASISDAQFWRSDIDRLNSKSSYRMFEHALNFRFGSEMLKFQLQLASYHGLDSENEVNAIPFWNASIMLGLVASPSLWMR